MAIFGLVQSCPPKKLKGRKRMWPDTLFISPVPNIRFLFFKVAYYHHYRPSSYYHSFQRSILISICGYWKRRLFFNWPTFVTRCCCQKNWSSFLELSFWSLETLLFNFEISLLHWDVFRFLIWLKTTVLETWMWTKKYSNLGHTNAILKVFLSAFILTFLRDLNVHAKNEKNSLHVTFS